MLLTIFNAGDSLTSSILGLKVRPHNATLGILLFSDSNFLISVLICVGTTNLYAIVEHQNHFLFWNCWFLWPQFLLFFFSAVAETNRAPFDLAEAEAELVAGYFVEYSAMAFALFFLGEYSSMGRICTLYLLISACISVEICWGGCFY